MPRKYLRCSALIFIVCAVASGHDPITTKLTWTREISRIVYPRCISCHRPGGASFSLMTYKEARPWAKAIAEEVLERRMPPWGAVKGFGDFRNDQALTQEQLELIANWVDGGAPEGEPKDLPPRPKVPPRSPVVRAGPEIILQGEFTVARPISLDGIWPKTISPASSLQITAEFPDGSIEPLLWLRDYQPRYSHPFLLRTPLHLPRGTMIRGIPPGSRVALLITARANVPARRNARYSPRLFAGTVPRSGTPGRAEKSY